MSFISRSSNGTFVNGKLVGKGHKQLLKSGDELSLVVRTAAEARVAIRTSKGLPFIAYLFQDPNAPELQSTATDLDEAILRRYFIQETLGSGHFAAVRLAVHKQTAKQFAVKLIDKRKFRMSATLRPEQLMDEVRVLQDVNHSNIIGIEEVFDGDRYLYIFLELVTGGDLFDRIVSRKPPTPGRYPESEAKLVMYQIGSAIQYMHRRNIAHRDLKPENILLVSHDSHTHCKLSDFGLAKVIGEQVVMRTLCGTPGYLAPEVLLSQGQTAYTLAVDLWSLGVVAYVMLAGYPAFQDEPQKVIKGDFDMQSQPWPTISEDAKDLIRKLLTVEVEKRIDIDQMLGHAWFAGVHESPSVIAFETPPQQPPTSPAKKHRTEQIQGSPRRRRRVD